MKNDAAENFIIELSRKAFGFAVSDNYISTIERN